MPDSVDLDVIKYSDVDFNFFVQEYANYGQNLPELV